MIMIKNFKYGFKTTFKKRRFKRIQICSMIFSFFTSVCILNLCTCNISIQLGILMKEHAKRNCAKWLGLSIVKQIFWL